MLGTDLALACEAGGDAVRVLDLPEFDITREQDLANALADINIVVNCAAYTNVEKAESEVELANEVNGQAVGKLGRFARETGKWVLHISTDFVFDGKSDRPYVEIDAPNPINVYGRSKLLGEQLLVESRCRNCIMRVEWTYGLNGPNFVAKLIERAKTGEQLKVVDDQVGSPTATTEVAKVILELVQKKTEGLFHFAASGYVSRFEMAQYVSEKLGLSVDVNSCKTQDFVCAAARPLNSRFDCGKIQALLDRPIECWQGPLEHFLRRL